jgi:nucleotide-binding universal stress UspA family protein
MLDQLLPSESDVQCERRLLMGDPATEIVALAEEENVDLIVMGTHGRTGIKRLLMGSVAEAVVRRASCPVFTYKQPRQVASEKT